jgi:hypothetical protein
MVSLLAPRPYCSLGTRSFDFPPKLAVGDAAAFLYLLVGLLEDGPQGTRTPDGDLLGLGFVLDGQQQGDRLAVARD